ncbi:hypothetical protein Tsubulata_034764 [Turnera subulata]|uniref:F-box domain-containing protein n=1 Tax=Turnera subulata TaxID=218843 RepID=A0A9Q0F9U1_9ROSI|nr:hypothetical protein Tsubulata_034764 [Turnera subulata]
METPMKKTKREEEEKGGKERDRLSQLPDDILINILLPLLDINTLTLTSTLSTRWHKLYLSTARHLDILNITVADGNVPRNPRSRAPSAVAKTLSGLQHRTARHLNILILTVVPDYNIAQNTRSSASSAVAKTLSDLQHLVKISGLIFTIRVSCGDQPLPESVLHFALSRDVEHLNFRPHFADDCDWHTAVTNPLARFRYIQRRQHCSPFYSKTCRRWYLGLPPKLFASRSLKTLSLLNCHLPEQRFRLPATVTVLHAERCLFEDGNHGMMLFDFNTISPGLEELTIVNCDFVGEGRILPWLPGTEVLDVKIVGGSKLASLTIECNKLDRRRYCTPIKITAPVLTSFRVVVHVLREGIVSVDFPSLKNAVVDFFDSKETNFPGCSDQEERNRVCANLCRLLQGLHNSESVSLSSTVIKALNAAPGMLKENPSPLVRLKSLKVGGVDNPEGSLPYLSSEVEGYLLGGSPGAELVSSP